jgi:hypothetical protein
MLSEIIQKCETVAKCAAVDHSLLPLLSWKSNKFYIFWVCVCGLSYTACNMHAPYCHLWPVWLYCIFPHYLINSMIIGKKYLKIKRVFWLSVQLVCETLLILRRIHGIIILNVHRSLCKIHITVIRFEWNLNFLDRFSKKY